jgi:EAL domain-containing protein (putative c-di-GMP-specific phosphodiesterase class I)
MIIWDSIFDWGRRASDQHQPRVPIVDRDRQLESVIAHEEIEVQYQPMIEPGSGIILGAEALIRASIEPDAEQLFRRAAAAKLDERLSRLVQRIALRRAAAWEGPLKGLSISLNLLPSDIRSSGYEDWLLAEVEAAGIDPARVILEITESEPLGELDAIAVRLTTLREAGIRIALDDFGTGYASLAYLMRLPLDILKIDRDLIANIATGERDRCVVGTIIELARGLGLTVLVEGVESTPQLAMLSQWGCDLYQGFLGAGALNEDELARFVGAANVEAAA